MSQFVRALMLHKVEASSQAIRRPSVFALSRAVSLLVMSVALGGVALADTAPPVADPHFLSHKAVYKLKLLSASQTSVVTGVTGEMTYEFIGTACAGYKSDVRFYAEISDTSGETHSTDIQSKGFESGDGQRMEFSTQTFADKKLDTESKGVVRIMGDKTELRLEKPEVKNITFPAKMLFPTAQYVALINAAKNGDNIMEAPIYDGSEPADTGYRSNSVIGAKNKGEQASDSYDLLKGVDRWPVTVTYFNFNAVGDQTPEHTVTTAIYANGVSGRMVFDYGDFQVEGLMTSLEKRDDPACPSQ